MDRVSESQEQTMLRWLVEMAQRGARNSDERGRLAIYADEVGNALARLRAPVDPPERVSEPIAYTCFECHAEGLESDDGYCEVNEGLAAVCSRECWEAFAARYDEPVARVSEASALRDSLKAIRSTIRSYRDGGLDAERALAVIESDARRALEDTKGADED